jgi:large subunit ribosomal protein L4
MSKLAIVDMKGQSVGEFDLADDLLVLKKGLQAVHDAVVAYASTRRAGTASTLGKGAVAGSNKKPWKQKGTGRARAGYRRSPVWRGGGVAHGPHPHSYEIKLPKRQARLAFRRALSDKVAAGEVKMLDQLTLPETKTKALVATLKSLGVTRGALLVMDTIDRNMALASRNVPGVEVTTARNINTYQIMNCPLMIVTVPAMTALKTRLESRTGSGE